MDVKGRVLITGGTSGLGLELVKLFLRKGFIVVTTGRRMLELPEHEGRFIFYHVDFADLSATSELFGKISKTHEFDYIIYNAGILSPPDFTTTKDGFEYTFQINFLAHFLVNEIIIRHHAPDKPLRVVAVTSMAYRVAEPDFNYFGDAGNYRAWKAYSGSKLYLVLMCRYFAGKLSGTPVRFYSYDPGIFGSELYRTQKGIFRRIYQLGVKILRHPAVSAEVLAEILTDPDLTNGAVYDVRKRIRKVSLPGTVNSEAFWTAIHALARKYLK